MGWIADAKPECAHPARPAEATLEVVNSGCVWECDNPDCKLRFRVKHLDHGEGTPPEFRYVMYWELAHQS